jgi:trimethylamine--corrinoid protein Co-methyltransferase
LIYVNAIQPKAPAMFGTWCFVSDLRTGAMSGGSPEQALLSAASAQIARYYDLTGATASGIYDNVKTYVQPTEDILPTPPTDQTAG